jgi:hypothetical protein
MYETNLASYVELFVTTGCLIATILLLRLMLWKETKKLLSSKSLLFSVIGMVAAKGIYKSAFFYNTVPVRDNALAIVTFMNGKFYLYGSDIFAWVIGFMIDTFFAGLISCLVVQFIKGNKETFSESISKINFWYPRTLFVMFLGSLGCVSVILIASNTTEVLFFPLMMIWNLLTYSILITVLDEDSSLFKSIQVSVVNGYNYFGKWWKLLLMQSILLGGITFAWLPQSFASNIPNLYDRNIFLGFFLPWLGDYYTNFRWANEMFNLADIQPSVITNSTISLFVVILAVAVKLRIANDLITKDFQVTATKEFESINNYQKV